MATLTNEELATLILNGDMDAREKLAEQNMGLIYHIVKKFINSGVPFDDLYSQGLFGLTKAINTFKPEKGFKFATYAAKLITNDILMFLRKHKKYRNDISIETEISQDSGGQSLTILDTLTDDSHENEVDMSEIYELLDLVLKNESGRDRFIVESYIKKERSQREIAEQVNLTQSIVSRIISKTLQKVKLKAFQTGLLDSHPMIATIEVSNVQKGPNPKEKKEVKRDMAKSSNSPGKPDEFTEDKYIKLRAEGLSNRQIGALYGRSDSWVHGKKKEWSGLTAQQKVRTSGPTREAYEKLLVEKKALEVSLSQAKNALVEMESVRIVEHEGESASNNSLIEELTSVQDERDQLFMFIGKLVYQNRLLNIS
jgi:RNA polymerase sporulation-specific sigma factor